MKKLVFVALGCFCASLLFAQGDSALNRRIAQFLKANREMNFERVLDFTYPKLFTIAPRDEMAKVLKSSFDNEQMTITMDSLKTTTVFPVFGLAQGSYAKILYSMKMMMELKGKEETAEKQKEKNELMLAAMQSQFGDKASLDSSGHIILYMNAVMVAVKDSYAKQWCFVNLKENDPLTSQLFSNEILDKLATYK